MVCSLLPLRLEVVGAAPQINVPGKDLAVGPISLDTVCFPFLLLFFFTEDGFREKSELSRIYTEGLSQG